MTEAMKRRGFPWKVSFIIGAVSAAAGAFLMPLLAVLIGPCHGSVPSLIHLIYLPVIPFAALWDPRGMSGLVLTGASGYGTAGAIVTTNVLIIRRYG